MSISSPSTTLPVVPASSIWTPSAVLPEMTSPAPATVPPIVLLVAQFGSNADDVGAPREPVRRVSEVYPPPPRLRWCRSRDVDPLVCACGNDIAGTRRRPADCVIGRCVRDHHPDRVAQRVRAGDVGSDQLPCTKVPVTAPLRRPEHAVHAAGGDELRHLMSCLPTCC